MIAIVRSELLKARSTRASAVTVALAIAISAGIAALLALSWRNSGMAVDQSALDASFTSFYALTIGQILLVVFAVLLVGTEYSTGTIRTSLVAVPLRGRFLAGKLIAGGLILVVVSVVMVTASFLAVQSVLGPYAVWFNESKVLWGFLGACAYLPLMGLFAMAITAILRSSVAAMAILLPLLFLNSQGLGNVPGVKDFAQYLPDQAGMTLMQMVPADDPRFNHDYGVVGALAIVVLWAVAAVIGGYLVTRRREA